jgi:BASS family bile acid:Na+ symporter
MDAAQPVKLALTASILLLVFGLGLRATFADATTLFREFFRPPNRLLRAVFAMYVAVPLVAIVMVPFGVEVLGGLFGREARFGPDRVAKLVAVTILAPLIVGLLVRHLAPRLADRMAPWASRLGTVVLVTALVPVIASAWPAIVSLVGDGAVLAITVVVAAAIASSMRHPGIALAIATLNVPEEPRMPAAILLCLVVATLATSVYGAVRRRQRTRAG